MTGPAEPGWIRRLTAQCLQHRRLVVLACTATLIAVAVDLATPLRFRVRPGELRVLAPTAP